MARTLFFCFLVTIAATACQLSTHEQEGNSGDSAQAEPVPAENGAIPGESRGPGEGSDRKGDHFPAVNRNAVLMENSVSRQFDGKDGEEQFRVALLGDSILTGTVAFTITNAAGELIYSDEFPAVMLAATYDESINTPARQEALIEKRINEFFQKDRFRDRAIEGDEPPHDSFFIEKDTYDNLKETNATGFLYLIGKENTKHIAWSPLEGKVVMYFNCC